MWPGESGGRLRQIKGSQDIVLFKEEGDIYCLKKRKTERHKKNIERTKTHVHTTRDKHTREREREKMATKRRSKVAGVGMVSS